MALHHSAQNGIEGSGMGIAEQQAQAVALRLCQAARVEGGIAADGAGITALDHPFHQQRGPQARRQGLGRHVLRALTQWATQHGANKAYLQVEERNTAAVSLYGTAGFATHHTYLTREAPDG